MTALIESGVLLLVGLAGLWYMGAKPKDSGRRGLISRVLK